MISTEDFTNIVNEYGYFKVHDFSQRQDCNTYLDHELVIIPDLYHLNEIPDMNVYDEVDMENFKR